MKPAEQRLLVAGAVVDRELVTLEPLMSQLLRSVEGQLTLPEISEALAVQRRVTRALWDRREELRPWGVE